MTSSTRPRLAFVATSLTVLVAAWLVVTVVDLDPKVESDFFFSTDDPQLQASRRIGELFPAGEQILVGALSPDIASDDYVERIRGLTDALAALDDVASVHSLTSGPGAPQAVADSPLWSRLLLGDNPNLTQLVVSLAPDADGRALVAGMETLLAEHDRPSFQLDASGVPWVVEQIRRALGRDLRVFSTAALIVFGLLVALVYRSVWIVAGTLFSCLGACLVTLAVLWWIGAPIGLLTANIVTLVFVLTLSHLVFLTANWRRAMAIADRDAEARASATDEAVGQTFAASVWCMATTLLGFGSLLFANAKPLRELGLAGAVGTAVAIAVAYGLYPGILHRLAGRSSANGQPRVAAEGRFGQRLAQARVPATIGILAVTVFAALGLPRLDTDPNLLSYFDADSALYEGLERIDRHGGSSPLDLVVRHPDGERLDTKAAQERMVVLQDALEADPAVASALSLPVLLGEAKLAPMAFMLSSEQLVDIMGSAAFDRVALGFVTEDRTLGRYFIRLREADLAEPRRDVIARLQASVEDAGLELEATGGLYELQASLGELVRSSVVRGLAGLFV
ncbi:MAG: MMPL family transporter, partial [Acidobacteriota bacterium]